MQAKYVSKDAYRTVADDELEALLADVIDEPEETDDSYGVSLSDDIYGEEYHDEPEESFFARAVRKIKGFFGF